MHSSNKRKRSGVRCGRQRKASNRKHVPVLVLLVLLSLIIFTCFYPQSGNHEEDIQEKREDPRDKKFKTFEAKVDTPLQDELKRNEDAGSTEKTWSDNDVLVRKNIKEYDVNATTVIKRLRTKDTRNYSRVRLSTYLSGKVVRRQTRQLKISDAKERGGKEESSVTPSGTASEPSTETSSKYYFTDSKETLRNRFTSIVANAEVSTRKNETDKLSAKNLTECSECDWNQTNNETRQLCEGEGRIEWEEPSVSCSCVQQISWHIKPKVPDYGIIVHLTHFNFKWYEMLEVYAGDRRTAENLLMQFPSLTNAVQLLPQPEILVWVRTLPWPFFTTENFPSSFGLNYSTHPMRYMPIKVSLHPLVNHLEFLLAKNYMYNCSTPYTVPQYILCDMVQQCIGGEDEPINCSYKSVNCGEGWFPYRSRKCLKFVTGYTAERSNACKSESDSRLAILPEPAERVLVGNVVGRMGINNIILNVNLNKNLYAKEKHQPLYSIVWHWELNISTHGDFQLQEDMTCSETQIGLMFVVHGEVMMRAVTLSANDTSIFLMSDLCMKDTNFNVTKQYSMHVNISSPGPVNHDLKWSIKTCPEGSFVQNFDLCPSNSDTDKHSFISNLFDCIMDEQKHFSVLCDGIADCRDGSDERHCTYTGGNSKYLYFRTENAFVDGYCAEETCQLKWKWYIVIDYSMEMCFEQKYLQYPPSFRYQAFFEVTSSSNADAAGQDYTGSCDSKELDIVIAVHMISIDTSNLNLLKKNLMKMLLVLKDSIGRIQIGIVSLGANLHVHFKLNSFKSYSHVSSALSKIQFEKTAPNVSVKVLLKKVETVMFSPANGDRPHASNLILLIFGPILQSTLTPHEQYSDDSLKRHMEDGIHTVVIAVDNGDNVEALMNLASYPLHENIFMTKNFNDTLVPLYKIAAALCPMPWVAKAQEWRKSDGHSIHLSAYIAYIDDENGYSGYHPEYKYMHPPAILTMTGDGRSMLEKLKDGQSCPEDHFQCPGGFCIPIYMLNNGLVDCPLAQDENIKNLTCPGYYRCYRIGNCLHLSYLCDNVWHCRYGDDEHFCMNCPVNCTCEGYAAVCRGHIKPDSMTENYYYWLQQLRYLDLNGSSESDVYALYDEHKYIRLHNLLFLNLSFCNLNTFTSPSSPRLRILDLSHNRITANTFKTNRLLELQVLNISFNNFRGFKLFLDLLKLHTLVMENTGLDINLVNDVNRMPLLRSLNIHANPELQPEKMSNKFQVQVLYTDNPKLCCSQFHADKPLCISPLDELSSCDDMIKSDLLRAFLWITAITTVTGTVGMLVYHTCIEQHSFSLSYKLFVISHSAANFLMGVYMVTVGGADISYRSNYVLNDTKWRNSLLCKAAGFLVMLSSEISAFDIWLITLDSLLVQRFPVSTHLHLYRFSVVLGYVASWAVSVILTVIPLLQSDWNFYSQNSICFPLLDSNLQHQFPGQQFAFGVFIVFNFTLFVVIAVGQVFIYLTNRKTANVKPKYSSKEEIIIARRLFPIIFTAFVCWISIGLMGLLASQGKNILVVFMLLLNSAINPLLYALYMMLEKRASKKKQKQVVKMICRLQEDMRAWPRDKIVEHLRFCLREELVDKNELLD